MPLIKYRCSDESCNTVFSVFYRNAGKAQVEQKCSVCGLASKRVLSGPSSVSKMVIDNGQARAVETYTEIMDLRKDRTKPVNRGD